MNLAASAPSWLLLILAAALAAAAIEDAVRLRISNVTCLAVLISALVAMGLEGFPLALWQNALVFVVLLVLGTPLFASGKVGGGDIKLLACIGLWMDFRSVFWLLAAVFIAGGVLALLYLGPRIVIPAPRGEDGKPIRRQIPYGLAIVAGACLVFASQLGWMKPEPVKPNPFSVRV
ncbi:MAG TPA: prepilin peptidase [Sphingomicrobium sp.]|nr:prepilin peptidase [Sphingomicrobium sp.]